MSLPVGYAFPSCAEGHSRKTKKERIELLLEAVCFVTSRMEGISLIQMSSFEKKKVQVDVAELVNVQSPLKVDNAITKGNFEEFEALYKVEGVFPWK